MWGPSSLKSERAGVGNRTVSLKDILVLGLLVALAAVIVPLVIRFTGL